MLSLLRALVSPRDEDMHYPLALEVGASVTFGAVPQKNIRQRRFALNASQTYEFDGCSFVAYHMDVSGVHHQMILSDAHNEDAFLALSQLLDERVPAMLLVGYLPHDWFGLEVGASVKVRPVAYGGLSGWFASSYTVVMQIPGKVYEGQGEDHPEPRVFDYVLLVDEHNQYALEAERYTDDTLRVFATVYRPVTDIIRLEEAPAPVFPVIVKQEDALLEETPDVVVEGDNKAEEPIETSAEALHEEIVKPAMVVESIVLAVAPTTESVVEDAPLDAVPMMPEQAHMLVCDVGLAGRIIDEAQRNAMGLEELVRKVIDLPAHIHEQVYIPFKLSDQEYTVLAKRYELKADDHSAIHAKILEELSQFAGVRKRKG